MPVLRKYDEQNDMADVSGAHKRASTEKDQTIIVQELQKTKVFNTIPGRRHASFPRPKNILREKKVETWIVDRL